MPSRLHLVLALAAGFLSTTTLAARVASAATPPYDSWEQVTALAWESVVNPPAEYNLLLSDPEVLERMTAMVVQPHMGLRAIKHAWASDGKSVYLFEFRRDGQPPDSVPWMGWFVVRAGHPSGSFKIGAVSKIHVRALPRAPSRTVLR